MNYLAHLFLSPDIPEIRVGNLMGDFAKGANFEHLPEPVQQGIYLHRKIDKFTDQHPTVKALKQLLSPERRRFSGIISDIVFDHLLAKLWSEYSESALTDFAKLRYQELNDLSYLMPEQMQLMTSRMIYGNWLEGYQEQRAVSGAINGVSKRIRFNNNLFGAAEEVMPAIAIYQQAFVTFFPELIQFVEQEIDQQL